MFVLKIIRNQHASSQRTLLRALHGCGSITLNKELIQPEAADSILQTIKSATHTLELLNIIARSGKSLSSEQVMESLKSLFSLQKSGNSSIKNTEIINHPQFEQLLRDLRKTSRTLPLNDIIEALKILSYIGISANANIAHILLNFLRQQINDVTLGHVIFLDFLLKKFEKTPLVEALQMALPLIFQLQLKVQMDHENVAQLTQLLLFASRNRVSNQSVMSIISSLTLHGTNLTLEEAISVTWSLCHLRPFKSNYAKLLENCFNVLNKNYRNLSFEKIDSTLTRLTDRCCSNINAFYNEEFFNKCASYVTEMDVGFKNAVYVLRKFNKVGFVNIFLLDYLAQKASEDGELLADGKPIIYFNFITGLSMANYTPKQWDQIKPAVESNPLLKSDRPDLPWMKFATELISLNFYHNDLLEKIFSDEFLETQLAGEQNSINYSQLLLLYQSVSILARNYSGPLPNPRLIDKAIELNLEKYSFPLTSSLKLIFGDSARVCTKVTTKYGHLIDHAIVFDEKNEPISINTDPEKQLHYLEDIQRANHQIVGIVTFPETHYAFNFPRLRGTSELRIRTLEALGVNVVAVNLRQWASMPEKEKLAYLEREIRYKIDTRCKV